MLNNFVGLQIMKKLIPLIVLLSVNTITYAATDGSLGATSTGSLVVTANRDDFVQITDMDDITIDIAPNATGTLVNSDDVCYYASTDDYSVDISSTNDFKLISTDLDEIAYSINWNDTAAVTTTNFNSNSTAKEVLISQNTTNTHCNHGTNANIEISIQNAAYNSTPVGSYTDTISVLISLE